MNELLENARALLDASHPAVTTLSNAAALLAGALENVNWTGFYLLEEDGALWLLDTNNRTVSRSTGETKDISDILSLKPKIVRSFETF